MLLFFKICTFRLDFCCLFFFFSGEIFIWYAFQPVFFKVRVFVHKHSLCYSMNYLFFQTKSQISTAFEKVCGENF